MRPAEQRRRMVRHIQLMAWAKHVGCCTFCAMGIAVAIVEREFGGQRYDWEHSTGRICAAKCGAMAREAIGAMPERAAPQVET